MAIDIGAGAISRDIAWTLAGYTLVDKNNPANASGTITSVEIWCTYDLAGCIVGIFYTTNGNTLKCRSATTIGAVTGGSKQTFPLDPAISVEAGDYIGIYFTGGWLEQDTDIYAGLWHKYGQYIDPNDEAEYTFDAGEALSLHGIGEEVAVGIPVQAFMYYQRIRRA